MSRRAIRARADDGDAPPNLQRMLRDWSDDHRANLQYELRKRRYFVGPAERRRFKAKRALQRLRRSALRMAA